MKTRFWLIIGLTYIITSHLLGQYYFYFTFQYYDKFLHASNPSIVLLMVWLLNTEGRLYLIWLATVGILGLNEIAEFLVDVYGNGTYRMQGVGSMVDGTMIMTPIADTMWDLILGATSSLVVVLILWLKRPGLPGSSRASGG